MARTLNYQILMNAVYAATGARGSVYPNDYNYISLPLGEVRRILYEEYHPGGWVSEAHDCDDMARELWALFRGIHSQCACGMIRLSAPVAHDIVGIVTDEDLVQVGSNVGAEVYGPYPDTYSREGHTGQYFAKSTGGYSGSSSEMDSYLRQRGRYPGGSNYPRPSHVSSHDDLYSEANSARDGYYGGQSCRNPCGGDIMRDNLLGDDLSEYTGAAFEGDLPGLTRSRERPQRDRPNRDRSNRDRSSGGGGGGGGVEMTLIEPATRQIFKRSNGGAFGYGWPVSGIRAFAVWF